jgi:hypothetical protein
VRSVGCPVLSGVTSRSRVSSPAPVALRAQHRVRSIHNTERGLIMTLQELLDKAKLNANSLTDVSSKRDKSRIALRGLTDEQATILKSVTGDIVAPSGTVFSLVVRMKGDEYHRVVDGVRSRRPEYVEKSHAFLAKVQSVAISDL